MMRAGGMGGRIVPSEGNHGADGRCGYISWHRDKPPADMWPLPNYRMIKCFLNVYDVAENGGETAVVPGSFRLETGRLRRGPSAIRPPPFSCIWRIIIEN